MLNRSEQTPPERLVRGIGRWDLVALTVNIIVGAGIFGLPSKIYGLTGSWSVLAYLVCDVQQASFSFCLYEADDGRVD